MLFCIGRILPLILTLVMVIQKSIPHFNASTFNWFSSDFSYEYASLDTPKGSIKDRAMTFPGDICLCWFILIQHGEGRRQCRRNFTNHATCVISGLLLGTFRICHRMHLFLELFQSLFWLILCYFF